MKAFQSRLLCGLTLLLAAGTLTADPVHEAQVNLAVENWLKASPSPLNTPMNLNVLHTEAIKDAKGQNLFFVTHLAPQGFVLSSSDDLLEPIVSFSPTGSFEAIPQNPLFALVSNDMKGRLSTLKNAQHSRSVNSHQAKWQRLMGIASQTFRGPVAQVDDPRVDPMTRTRWNQTTVKGIKVYNRFTPENIACGCVGTAMSQIIRFHQWPVNPLGDKVYSTILEKESGTVRIDSKPRGGDGQGGAYNWSLMPEVPTAQITEDEANQIGSLTHDAGLALTMKYGKDGGAADTNTIATALTGLFQFSNAMPASVRVTNLAEDKDFLAKVNTNLDAGLPVVVGISGDGGHAVVLDGYGYNEGTSYHHINLGWGGIADAWYQLPDVSDDEWDFHFTTLGKVVYNMYPQGKDECVSGRAMDQNGQPVEGAVITLGAQSAQTNARGIFAFRHVAKGTYALEAVKEGFAFEPQSVTVNKSYNYGKTGNVWGVQINGIQEQPPVVSPLINGGFEEGATGWSGNVERIGNQKSPFEGQNAAWLCGVGRRTTHLLSQSLEMPANADKLDFSFQLFINTAEKGTVAYDKLQVLVLNEAGTQLALLSTFSNVNAASGFQEKRFDLSAYKGQKITLQFKATEDGMYQTSFVVDQLKLEL